MRIKNTTIGIIKRLLGGKNTRPLRSIISRTPAADLVEIFGLLNDREVKLFIDALIASDKISLVLRELPELQLVNILQLMDRPKLIVLLDYFPEDDAAFFLSLLEEEQRTDYLQQLDEKRRLRLIQLLSYPEDSAGRIMNSSVFCLPANLSAREGIEYLRAKAKEQSFYYIYIVDDEDRLMGVVSLRELATTDAESKLQNISKKDIITVSPFSPQEEVAQLVDKYGFVAVPVVDEHRKLIGVITVDEVVDIIQAEATADIYASAGLQEDDRVYSKAMFSFKNRIPWMALNMFTAILASSVVSSFEETMNQAIVLATLNNIVAGMGGNTAIQTLTIMTRGIALNDFAFTTQLKAVIKELKVGLLLGMSSGILAGIVIGLWKQNFWVGIIIGSAMALNAIIATGMGASIPLLLKKLKLDPAIGSGVLVTTMTDCFGFFSFLGIATLVLKYVGHL